MKERDVMDNVDLSKLSENERVYIERLSEGEGLTISETLKRLLRVFKGVLIFILLLAAVGIYEFVRSENGSFYTYLSIYFFTVMVFCYMAPVRLGAKVFYYRLI